MFGMLDYRAHKLYWLMSLPFRLVMRITFFVAIIVAILIAQSTSFGTLIKIVIAYVAFEAILLVVGTAIYAALGWVLTRFFFFLIDVVPAHGANAEEAKAIVLTGRAFELLKNLENDIENWTYDDTRELVSKANWRARWFFPIRERMEARIRELKRIHDETGQQPRDLGQAAIEKLCEALPNGKVSLLEKAIVNQQFFNSIVAFCIIVIIFAYIAKG